MGTHDPWSPDLELGDDHSLMWTGWSGGNRELNPQYAGIAPIERYGAIVRHRRGPSRNYGADDWPAPGMCEGGITFDTPEARAVHEISKRACLAQGLPEPEFVAWTVQSWDPLTISPSLLCGCGDHGFIRQGRWVRA